MARNVARHGLKIQCGTALARESREFRRLGRVVVLDMQRLDSLAIRGHAEDFRVSCLSLSPDRIGQGFILLATCHECVEQSLDHVRAVLGLELAEHLAQAILGTAQSDFVSFRRTLPLADAHAA